MSLEDQVNTENKFLAVGRELKDIHGYDRIQLDELVDVIMEEETP